MKVLLLTSAIILAGVLTDAQSASAQEVAGVADAKEIEAATAEVEGTKERIGERTQRVFQESPDIARATRGVAEVNRRIAEVHLDMKPRSCEQELAGECSSPLGAHRPQ